MVAWKHHLASDFGAGVPRAGNGVGAGGTVFLDLGLMARWMGSRAGDWLVAPVWLEKDELEFDFPEPFMATSKVDRLSLAPFAPVEEWAEAQREQGEKEP